MGTAAGFQVGPGRFDVSGQLVGLGELALIGPRVDLSRATTDNDRGGWPKEADHWRRVGLHRVRHRIMDVAVDDDALVVRTRVAPAAVDFGLFATYRWTSVDAECAALRLDLEITPDGEWSGPLPRLGLRLGLPAAIGQVDWFGRGPGEAYADSRLAARVGRFAATVDQLQTPYVFPQENGSRADVRWATLTDDHGHGLRIDGDPMFALTARRWTSEQLEAARHGTDLVPGEHVWVNVDIAQHGLGTASCGPGVLPHYALYARATSFGVMFTLR
jgi:beta-galactosidase